MIFPGIVLGFVIGFVLYFIYLLWGHVHFKRKASNVEVVDIGVFKFLLEDIQKLNDSNVRYLIVDELPAIEDVEDRRTVYIRVIESKGVLWNYNIYTPVAGTWYTVEMNVDMSDYLGKVE